MIAVNFIFVFSQFYFQQPPKYKLAAPLSRLLGIHTQTRPVIINAIWQYIKVSKTEQSEQEIP